MATGGCKRVWCCLIVLESISKCAFRTRASHAYSICLEATPEPRLALERQSRPVTSAASEVCSRRLPVFKSPVVPNHRSGLQVEPQEDHGKPQVARHDGRLDPWFARFLEHQNIAVTALVHARLAAEPDAADRRVDVTDRLFCSVGLGLGFILLFNFFYSFLQIHLLTPFFSPLQHPHHRHRNTIAAPPSPPCTSRPAAGLCSSDEAGLPAAISLSLNASPCSRFHWRDLSRTASCRLRGGALCPKRRVDRHAPGQRHGWLRGVQTGSCCSQKRNHFSWPSVSSSFSLCSLPCHTSPGTPSRNGSAGCSGKGNNGESKKTRYRTSHWPLSNTNLTVHSRRRGGLLAAFGPKGQDESKAKARKPKKKKKKKKKRKKKAKPRVLSCLIVLSSRQWRAP